jgi:UDP-N-acetyl-D-galactosamine dehydrogenase
LKTREDKDSPLIGIVGLGYVGLPLAVAFAEKFRVVGYDINQERVNDLRNGIDRTLEIENNELSSVLVGGVTDLNSMASGLVITDNVEDISTVEVYIITVPTPTDKNNRPVLTPLERASEAVGALLSKGNIVIYESTVYPGVTEETCVPILEATSGLKFNDGFYVGYSPERINPGDKDNTVKKIKKVTSGSTKEVAREIDELYKTIITAGTFSASSIKVAEASKVIENSQRDINIAFMNELSKIFNLIGIDTTEVLEAAGTKWNFLPFKPGLVGGHCIGVDPYYLAQKAQELGYYPGIILAGRRLNDSMGQYVASEVVKIMIKKGLVVPKSRILMLGITFKENCPDIRNTRAIDIYRELESYEIQVDVADPWADAEEVKDEYGITLEADYGSEYDGVILAVSHEQFASINVRDHVHPNGFVYDVKSFIDKSVVDGRL